MKEEIIKSNLEVFERRKKEIDNNDYSWYSSMVDYDHFKCVECGDYCSTKIFIFYGKNPKEVKCYKCQNKN